MPAPTGSALAAATFGSWSIYLAVREAKAALFYINPLVTYAVWQGIELGLAELYIVYKYGNNSIPFGSHSLTPGELAYGHAIMVVGACALYCGMKHCQPRQTL